MKEYSPRYGDFVVAREKMSGDLLAGFIVRLASFGKSLVCFAVGKDEQAFTIKLDVIEIEHAFRPSESDEGTDMCYDLFSSVHDSTYYQEEDELLTELEELPCDDLIPAKAKKVKLTLKDIEDKLKGAGELDPQDELEIVE